MKVKMVDAGKNVLFLFIILILLITAVVFVLLKMGSESFEQSLSTDKILKVLIVIEDKGIPISSNVIAYYPETKRAAMFDIPPNTGLIIQSLGRTDGIGSVYTEKGIEIFKKEIEKLTGISIPFYLTFSLDDFAALTDLLGGFSVFIPAPVDIDNETARILLPSGSVLLDGDKVKDYLVYEDELDGENEAASRRQKAILAMFRTMSDASPDIFLKYRFNVLKKYFNSNINGEEIDKFIESICKLDSERLVPQHLTGAVRYVEGKRLLTPFRDGQQLKEVIRQTISVLASDNTSALERIYAVEILNGTSTQGLAKKTEELYASFGYDVVTIGNSEDEIEETVLIDRIGNPELAKVVGQVIRCNNIQTVQLSSDSGSETNVDFTIILGRDFNGYFVKQKK